MHLRSGIKADKTYTKRVYTRKTIPTDSLTLPTTSSIVMSLDETITAVRDNAVGDLDEAKVHLRLLVETVTEQNRFIQDNNATRELITTLQRAETDRLRADTISQENQLALYTAQIQRERERAQAELDREEARIEREAIRDQTATALQNRTNQTQFDLIELIQRLQTASATIALNTLNVASAPKPRNLNSSQANFVGKANENVDEWLYNTRQNLNMAHIPADEHVSLAATYLKEAAQQYYRHRLATAGAFANWDAFEIALRQQFLPPNYNATLLINLENCKQTGTVDRYVHDFLYIANQVQEVSDFVKVHIFTANLQADVSAEVRYKKPITLTAAIQIASDFTNSKRAVLVTELNYIKSHSSNYNVRNSNKSKTCFHCNKPGHIKSECRKLQTQKLQRNHFNSNQQTNNSYNNANNANNTNGNYHNNNLRRFPNREYNNQFANRSTNYNRNTVNNRSSKRVKNIAGDDDDTSHSNNMIQNGRTNLPTATAIIHGSEMQVIFDTGASQSVMGLRLVERFNIPYQKTNEKCKLGNNESIEIIGITNTIEVIVFGSICKLKFLILPRHNVLLGCDWNKLVNASVETYTNTLVFGRRAIPLQSQINNDIRTSINTIEFDEFKEEQVDCWPSKPIPIHYKNIKEVRQAQELSNVEVLPTDPLDFNTSNDIGKQLINTTEKIPYVRLHSFLFKVNLTEQITKCLINIKEIKRSSFKFWSNIIKFIMILFIMFIYTCKDLRVANLYRYNNNVLLNDKFLEVIYQISEIYQNKTELYCFSIFLFQNNLINKGVTYICSKRKLKLPKL